MKCTSEFSTWMNKLDRSIRIRVDQRLSDGHTGLHKRFSGILEIKWRTGTMGSFRIYCAEVNGIILLLGGHKDSQSRDIEKALTLFDGVTNGKTRIKEYE